MSNDFFSTSNRIKKTPFTSRNEKAGVKKVAFDRSGFKFHGRIQALANAARENGLEF